MGVIFSAEAEKRRLIAAQKARAKTAKTWELLKTSSMAEALHFAKANGWKEKKVQVKETPVDVGVFEYYVEPFERDCKCPNILKYSDYFD